MSRELSISKFVTKLAEAIDRGDWQTVDVCRNRLKTLLLEAALDDAPLEIASIDASLARARGQVVFGRGVDLSPGPEGAAWMLAADTETARLVGYLRPRPTAKPVDGSAKERVMAVLHSTNRGGLSNRQLSQQTGLSPETVARVLKVLREEGRVTSRKIGRLKINRPTARSHSHPPYMRSKVLIEQWMYAEEKVASREFVRISEKNTTPYSSQFSILAVNEAPPSKPFEIDTQHDAIFGSVSAESVVRRESKIDQKLLTTSRDHEAPSRIPSPPNLMNQPRADLEIEGP